MTVGGHDGHIPNCSLQLIAADVHSSRTQSGSALALPPRKNLRGSTMGGWALVWMCALVYALAHTLCTHLAYLQAANVHLAQMPFCLQPRDVRPQVEIRPTAVLPRGSSTEQVVLEAQQGVHHHQQLQHVRRVVPLRSRQLAALCWPASSG